jgi:hypothetical protein
MLHKGYDRKGSVEKKSLVVNLKGLGTKMNWLAVNCRYYSNSDFDCSSQNFLLFYWIPWMHNFKKNCHKGIAHTSSHMKDLDYVTLETKLTVAQYTTVGCWIPNKNKISPTSKTGFEEITIRVLVSGGGIVIFLEISLIQSYLGAWSP